MAGMNAGAVCSLMDGLVSTITASADAGQYINCWVEGCKSVVRLPGNRELTDWKFQAISSIIKTGPTEVGAADLIGATKLYAFLLASVDDTAEDSFVVIFDADSGTLDGSAALHNDAVAMIRPSTVASASIEEFIPMIWHKGLSLGTGLTIHADGVDGTDTTASELRGWILFR